ncbi:MAG: hypothetical protein KDI36_13305 [Pseudomonadales bacterium]|nr:hypothetical protein [Pseudomonadales bacterium]
MEKVRFSYGELSPTDASFHDPFVNGQAVLTWNAGDVAPKKVRIPVRNEPESEALERINFQLDIDGQQIDGSVVTIIDDDFSNSGGRVGTFQRLVRVQEGVDQNYLELFRFGGSAGDITIEVRILSPGGAADNTADADDLIFAREFVNWRDGESGARLIPLNITDDDIEEMAELFVISLNVQSTSADYVMSIDSFDFNRELTGGVIFDDDIDVVTDTDSDGVPDFVDEDDDDDGVADNSDAFPLDAEESKDSDGDGVGDVRDLYPFDPQESADIDGDGIGDNFDTDDDNDLISDETELLNDMDPLNPEDALADPDGDGYTNAEEANSGSDINDPDSVPSAGIIEFASASTSGLEGQNLHVRVNRILGAAGTVSVSYKLVLEDLLSPADIVVVNEGVVTWDAGDISPKIITIPTVDDDIFETSEQGRLRLENPSGGAELGGAFTRIAVLDNETDPEASDHPGYITFSATDLRVVESQGYAEVELIRLDGSLGPLEALVRFGNSDREDIASGEYLLRWKNGDVEPKVIRIPVINDDEDERQKVLAVSVEGSSMPARSLFLTVIDDDFSNASGRIGLNQRRFVYLESDGESTIDLVRLGGAEGMVSATISFDQFVSISAADQELDYQVESQTVSWADGETGVKSIPIRIIDDSEVESFELIGVRISLDEATASDTDALPLFGDFVTPEFLTFGIFDNDIDVALDTDNDGVPNIADVDDDDDGFSDQEDVFPLDESEWLDSDGDGVGDNADSFPLNHSLKFDSDSDGIADQLDYDVDGDGIANESELLAGLDPIDPDDAFADLDGDGFNNAEEVNSGSDPEDAASVPGAGEVALVAANTLAEEGGEFYIQAHRYGGAAGPVSVNYELIPGTLLRSDIVHSLAESDEVPISGSISWASGETGVKRIVLSTMDNPIPDPVRIGEIQLTSVVGNATLGKSHGYLTLLDDDHSALGAAVPNRGRVLMTSRGLQVNEAEGVVEIDFIRIEGDEGEQYGEVLLLAGSSPLEVATAVSSDFDFSYSLTGNDIVHWADGERGLRTLTIPIRQDRLSESTERVEIFVDSLVQDGNDFVDRADLLIQDGDRVSEHGLIGFESRLNLVEESQGELEVVLTRKSGSVGEVTANITLISGTALPGEDFADSSYSVTWADGDAEPKSFVVTILDDAQQDEDEFFLMRLTIDSDGSPVADTGLQRPASPAAFGDAEVALGVILDVTDIDTGIDTDGDGIPDFADPDADNDGVVNALDAFPLDPTEVSDSDGDGIGDNQEAQIVIDEAIAEVNAQKALVEQAKVDYEAAIVAEEAAKQALDQATQSHQALLNGGAAQVEITASLAQLNILQLAYSQAQITRVTRQAELDVAKFNLILSEQRLQSLLG